MSNVFRINSGKLTNFTQILYNLQLAPVYISNHMLLLLPEECPAAAHSPSFHTFSSISGGILPYRMIGPLTPFSPATNRDGVYTVFYMNPEDNVEPRITLT